MSKAKSSTIEARISDFIAKAIERTKCIYEGKSQKANALEKDMGNIYRSLRACGRAEQEALLPLLNHPDASVRAEAAQFVLDFEPSKALPILEALAAIPRGGIPGSDADLTLDLWRSGEFRIS